MRKKNHAQKICIYALAYYLLSAIALYASSDKETEFKLVPDEHGILWIKGDRRPSSVAIKMAYHQNSFVILLGTSKEYKEQAIEHAIKLRKWFSEHPHMPEKITILAFEVKKNTVVYSYCLCDGLIYDNKDAPSGVLSPEQAYKFRDHVVIAHRAAVVIREEKASYLD